MKGLQVWIARGSILSLSTVVAFSSAFARTAVLSRFLLPEEFGITVAIATVLAMANLLTDLALDQFIINTKEDSPEALATVHVLSITRGLLLSTFLIMAAPVFANIFEVPQVAGSFALVAICPFLRSLNHLGIKQLRREFQYLPDIIAQAASQLLALAAALAGAYYFRDHRAIVVSFITETAVYVVGSHMLARAPYRAWPNTAVMRVASRFGLPLVLNGIGLAAIAQLDRMLVGYWLGVQALGHYAVIISLGLLPMAFFFRVVGPIASASLLACQDCRSRNAQYAFLLFFTEMVSVLYAFFVALTLDWVTPLIFGQTFHVSRSGHLLLVSIAFLRLLRGGAPTSFLLVAGRTGELALLNLTSGIGLIFALGVIYNWPVIEAVLLGLLVGECFANSLLFFGSSARPSLPRLAWQSDLTMSLISISMIVGALAYSPEPTWSARAIVFFVGLVGIGAQLAVGFRNHNRFALEGHYQRDPVQGAAKSSVGHPAVADDE